MATCKQCSRDRRLHPLVPICSRCIKRNKIEFAVGELLRGEASLTRSIGVIVLVLVLFAMLLVFLRALVSG
jgi:hypothetical protein